MGNISPFDPFNILDTIIHTIVVYLPQNPLVPLNTKIISQPHTQRNVAFCILLVLLVCQVVVITSDFGLCCCVPHYACSINQALSLPFVC